MTERFDAVTVLAGDFSEDRREIGPGTIERMDTALRVIQEHDIPNLVVAGSHPFIWRQAPPHPLARLMKGYAVDMGLPAGMVRVQDESLETVGDAVFTKTGIVEPEGWVRLALVTSDAHLPRGERIFGHVMGPGYTIRGMPSGEASAVKNQNLQEFVGSVLVRSILSGTEAGDTLAIQRRLLQIIPGYDNVPPLRRMAMLAKGIVVG